MCLVPRDIGNIGYTRHMTKTNKTQNHNITHKNGQPRDIGNIGYTRHMTKTNNLETLATLMCLVYPMLPMSLGCPFLCVVLWVCVLFVFVMCLVYSMFPMSLGIGNIGYTRHMTKTNNLETLATLGTQDT
jgi:hypothetical protein